MNADFGADDGRVALFSLIDRRAQSRARCFGVSDRSAHGEQSEKSNAEASLCRDSMRGCRTERAATPHTTSVARRGLAAATQIDEAHCTDADRSGRERVGREAPVEELAQQPAKVSAVAYRSEVGIAAGMRRILPAGGDRLS
jgi:hypothetical protein